VLFAEEFKRYLSHVTLTYQNGFVHQTVGYGTYNAESAVGKAMVYSVGFICILLFGWILSIAGYLSSAIFDDALVRFQLRRMTWPSISCLVWGVLYYIWMALIAVATFEYKVYRVGDTGFTMNQGYWFAYVSSTVSMSRVYCTAALSSKD
jgi:hypothetical protein